MESTRRGGEPPYDWEWHGSSTRKADGRIYYVGCRQVWTGDGRAGETHVYTSGDVIFCHVDKDPKPWVAQCLDFSFDPTIYEQIEAEGGEDEAQTVDPRELPKWMPMRVSLRWLYRMVDVVDDRDGDDEEFRDDGHPYEVFLSDHVTGPEVNSVNIIDGRAILKSAPDQVPKTQPKKHVCMERTFLCRRFYHHSGALKVPKSLRSSKHYTKSVQCWRPLEAGELEQLLREPTNWPFLYFGRETQLHDEVEKTRRGSNMPRRRMGRVSSLPAAGSESPALPRKRGRALRRRGTLGISSSGGEVEPKKELSGDEGALDKGDDDDDNDHSDIDEEGGDDDEDDEDVQDKVADRPSMPPSHGSRRQSLRSAQGKRGSLEPPMRQTRRSSRSARKPVVEISSSSSSSSESMFSPPTTRRGRAGNRPSRQSGRGGWRRMSDSSNRGRKRRINDQSDDIIELGSGKDAEDPQDVGAAIQSIENPPRTDSPDAMKDTPPVAAEGPSQIEGRENAKEETKAQDNGSGVSTGVRTRGSGPTLRQRTRLGQARTSPVDTLETNAPMNMEDPMEIEPDEQLIVATGTETREPGLDPSHRNDEQPTRSGEDDLLAAGRLSPAIQIINDSFASLTPAQRSACRLSLPWILESLMLRLAPGNVDNRNAPTDENLADTVKDVLATIRKMKPSQIENLSGEARI